jgi:hypothetical protein
VINKRIFELLKQATTDVNPEDREWVFSRVDQAKFAELIVRECLTVINQPNGVGDDDVIRISDDVKRHFGVEE